MEILYHDYTLGWLTNFFVSYEIWICVDKKEVHFCTSIKYNMISLYSIYYLLNALRSEMVHFIYVYSVLSHLITNPSSTHSLARELTSPFISL